MVGITGLNEGDLEPKTGYWTGTKPQGSIGTLKYQNKKN